MKNLKFLIGLSFVLVIVFSSCEKEASLAFDEKEIVLEQINSLEELENLMTKENYEPSPEFEEILSLATASQRSSCTNYSWETNSACQNTNQCFPISSQSNYIGGCMEDWLIDYFRLCIGSDIYYICAAGATLDDNGRYLLRVRTSNGKLYINNLTFWGDRIDVVINAYDANCNKLSILSQKNNYSANL